MTVANVVMTLLFLVAAGLQLNDPDPVGWTAIYLAAAVASAVAAARRTVWPFAALVGAAAIAWAASFGGRVISSGMLRHLARAMGPGSGAEEARELLGLTIVATWMLAIVVVRPRRSAGSWKLEAGSKDRHPPTRS